MPKIPVFSLFVLSAVVTFSPGILRAGNPDAGEIVKTADLKMRGTSSRSEMTMTVTRPAWTRTVSMKSWSKGNRYSLVLITAPAREKGQAFLKRMTEMWNWIPSIERTVKIPPSMMSQPWMGSDFSNDDLLKESSIVADYTHAITGEGDIDGITCFRIECLPRPGAPVVWGKVILWISKKDILELKAEYYDEDSVPVSIERLSEIKEMGGRAIPTLLEMVPSDKPGNKTVIRITSIAFDEPLSDDFFSLQNLRRIR